MTTSAESPYPENPVERRRWIQDRRGGRSVVTPERPLQVFTEWEATDETDDPVRVLTVLLVGRECPWRCVMCDLWRHTVTGPLPPGAVSRQLAVALREAERAGPLPPVIKLYNSGSFFDSRAVAPEDYAILARQLAPFQRVIVECHPKLIGERVRDFRRALARETSSPPRLEIAMGLETVHPTVLQRLNKGMTREDFQRAARFLRAAGIDLRAFVLVQPPFMPVEESVDWAVRSAAFAFAQGAAAVALIPVRGGSGVLEALAQEGLFTEPTLAQLEAAVAGAQRLNQGRVLADLWDLARFRRCDHCFSARQARLERFNRTQRLGPPVACDFCQPKA